MTGSYDLVSFYFISLDNSPSSGAAILLIWYICRSVLRGLTGETVTFGSFPPLVCLHWRTLLQHSIGQESARGGAPDVRSCPSLDYRGKFGVSSGGSLLLDLEIQSLMQYSWYLECSAVKFDKMINILCTALREAYSHTSFTCTSTALSAPLRYFTTHHLHIMYVLGTWKSSTNFHQIYL